MPCSCDEENNCSILDLKERLKNSYLPRWILLWLSIYWGSFAVFESILNLCLILLRRRSFFSLLWSHPIFDLEHQAAETDLDFQGGNTIGKSDTWEVKIHFWSHDMLHGPKTSLVVLYHCLTVKVQDGETNGAKERLRAECLSDRSCIFCDYKGVNQAHASLLCLSLVNSMFCSFLNFTLFSSSSHAHTQNRRYGHYCFCTGMQNKGMFLMGDNKEHGPGPEPTAHHIYSKSTCLWKNIPNCWDPEEPNGDWWRQQIFEIFWLWNIYTKKLSQETGNLAPLAHRQAFQEPRTPPFTL